MVKNKTANKEAQQQKRKECVKCAVTRRQNRELETKGKLWRGAAFSSITIQIYGPTTGFRCQKSTP